MKNILLAYACFAAASVPALAVDLDNPSTPVEYASETRFPAGGAQTEVSEMISGALGFGITDSASRFIRYDLPGASFLGLPELAISGQTGTEIVWVGGGVGTDYVIFEVVADSNTSISPTDIATLSFNSTSPNLALDGETVVVTFGNYFTAPGALSQAASDLLATSSAALLKFVPGTETAAVTGTTPLAIDVNAGRTLFVGGATRSAIGAIVSAEVPGDQFLLDGVTDITIAASRTSASRLSVLGDFTATVDASQDQYLPHRVFLSSDACASSILSAQSVTATEAVFQLGNTAYGVIDPNPALSSGPDICLEVNGVSVISESDYSAQYQPVSAPGFDMPEQMIVLESLRKNGASNTQNLVLTPQEAGGTFEANVRVTNTSATTGDVYFQLINDLGDRGPLLPLANVIGGDNSGLNAGASTRDIRVSEIYIASIASDPSWSLGPAPFTGLRLVTTGDFDSIAVTLFTLSLDQNLITVF